MFQVNKNESWKPQTINSFYIYLSRSVIWWFENICIIKKSRN